MHNNYYFLRQLSNELGSRIDGFTLVSCFSQNKDELILEFNNGRKSFYVKASLQPDFQCLSFPRSYNRARKNSIDLFQSLVMQKVSGVRQIQNDRSFAILLEDENALVFKMHGSKANVLWFGGQQVRAIFRNNFPGDLELKWAELDRTIDWSHEKFLNNQSTLQKTYFTLGNPVWDYLEVMNFTGLDPEGRWKLLQKTLAFLEKPAYHILENEKMISLSLLPSPTARQTFTGPMKAIHEFFVLRVSHSAFQEEKTSLLAQVKRKWKQSESFLTKTRQKLSDIESDHHYQQWADLIMANLNHIRQGQEKITVLNLYKDQEPIEITLKKELSPQKNAEAFYRKAKNRSIEIKTLRESIVRKEKETEQLKEIEHTILSAKGQDALEEIASSFSSRVDAKEKKQSLPYHEFKYKGFKIWVGKNAKANDELTLKHSFKEDLWLHAKDVAGSHVLLKHQAGKPFPKDVIEHTAGLAAHYSKRKNESLCPVAFTPKKYVRKRKGDPAGAVVVEREKVVLVEPWK